MHHIVADRKFRERRDMTARLLALLSPLFLFFSPPEEIALREERKANQRIFKASVQLAAEQHNGSRLSDRQLLLRLVRTKGRELIVLKRFRESARTGARRRHQNDGPALSPVAPQVFDQEFKVTREARNGLRRN